MTQFLKVSDGENMGIVEIPTEEDGTLSVNGLENIYSGATGLKYNVEDHTRLVKISDGKLIAPPEGWASHTYYCVFPKGVKRKKEDEDEESSKKSVNGSVKANWTATDLVVLGLAWKTTDKDLQDYFSQYGKLQFAQVKVDPVTKKSRGFGFIRFADNESQVRVLLQRHEINGRFCDVRVSESRDIATKRVPSKIFIGQCPQDITEDELRDHFSKYGEISDIFVPKPFRGFAFVTFVDAESAQAVCRQQQYIRDKKLFITEAIPKNSKELSRSKSAGRGSSGGRAMASGSRDDGYYHRGDRYASSYDRYEEKGWRTSSRYNPDIVTKAVNRAVMDAFENYKGGPSFVPEHPERNNWWSRR